MMDMFDLIGSYGPWQRRIFVIVLYIWMLSNWQTLSITFLAPNVDFRCIEPTPHFLNSTNSTFDDRCDGLVANGTSSERCTRWEYDTTAYSDTIVSKWDLVCDRQWMVSFCKSIYMLGILVSVLPLGQMSDLVGRFPTLLMCYVITTSSMFLSLLSSSYVMFAALRFFQAIGRTGLSTVGMVLVLEVMGPEHRPWAGAGIQFGWALGFLTLAGVAWFVRPWFWFQLVISLAFIPLGVAFWFVPESPRWLLMRGRKKRLERLLATAIRINGRELEVSVKDLDLYKENIRETDDVNKKTLYHLLIMPKMRKRIFIMFYLWLVNSFVYYGLSFNTNDIAGNPYINFFISGALEFPAYVLVYWGSVKAGRRNTLIALMFGGGAACVAVLAVPSSIPWLSITLAMLGKFCVTASYGVLYLYTSELFPTVVRNVSMGSCSMFARVGSILAPFVRELGQYTDPSVPNVLYGVLAVSSGVLVFLVPETKGKKMADTMEEGEAFGQSPTTDTFVANDVPQSLPMYTMLPQQSGKIKKLSPEKFDQTSSSRDTD